MDETLFGIRNNEDTLFGLPRLRKELNDINIINIITEDESPNDEKVYTFKEDDSELRAKLGKINFEIVIDSDYVRSDIPMKQIIDAWVAVVKKRQAKIAFQIEKLRSKMKNL